VEKRSVRLKAFPWKATSEAYALPLSFHRKEQVNQKKFGGNSDSVGQSIRVAVNYPLDILVNH
jgi:hypothetical protein